MTILDIFTIHVSEKTTWILFRLTDAGGQTGVGEATLNTRTADVLRAIPDVIDCIAASSLSLAAALRSARTQIDGIVGRTVTSAIEQAWLDLEGKRTGRPVHALLGGTHRRAVPCYANINRGTLSRTPEEFAERAALAANDGYPAIKLAPFDDVTPDDSPDADQRRDLIDAGFRRIEAIAKSLQGKVRIQVDCHSRFRRDEAHTMLERAAALSVAWFEEPIAEAPDALPAIADLRRNAQTRDVTLAGAENAANLGEFLPFLTGRCYDVIMPDIIRAGGSREVVHIGHAAAAVESAVSLHNPSGPVMDAHSMHVAAALPTLHSLERQFRETPLYDEIVTTHAARFDGGALHVSDAPGLGLEIDWNHPALHHEFTSNVGMNPQTTG